ncbi:hypothetical protein SNEBB_001719 [Seison nebaliae]|nr:hypothetical protein SNEBB_001719 [Seison nebaliae]
MTIVSSSPPPHTPSSSPLNVSLSSDDRPINKNNNNNIESSQPNIMVANMDQSIGSKNFQKYSSAVDRVIKLFDTAKEWADLINACELLLKTMNVYDEIYQIPKRQQLISKLTHCFHPNLPHGVHLKALSIFHVMFNLLVKAKRLDILAKELPILFYSLPSLFSRGAMNVKNELLVIVERYLMLLDGGELLPCLVSLFIGIMPGLEPGFDFYDRIYSLLLTINSKLYNCTKSFHQFYQCLWESMNCMNSSTKFQTFNFIINQFLKKEPIMKQTYLYGKHPEIMTNILCQSLSIIDPQQQSNMTQSTATTVIMSENDTNETFLLLQRAALEFLLQCLPLNICKMLLKSQSLYVLIFNACSTLRRRELALTRRVLLWLQSIEDDKYLILNSFEFHISRIYVKNDYGKKSLLKKLEAVEQRSDNVMIDPIIIVQLILILAEHDIVGRQLMDSLTLKLLSHLVNPKLLVRELNVQFISKEFIEEFPFYLHGGHATVLEKFLAAIQPSFPWQLIQQELKQNLRLFQFQNILFLIDGLLNRKIDYHSSILKDIFRHLFKCLLRDGQECSTNSHQQFIVIASELYERSSTQWIMDEDDELFELYINRLELGEKENKIYLKNQLQFFQSTILELYKGENYLKKIFHLANRYPIDLDYQHLLVSYLHNEMKKEDDVVIIPRSSLIQLYRRSINNLWEELKTVRNQTSFQSYVDLMNELSQFIALQTTTRLNYIEELFFEKDKSDELISIRLVLKMMDYQADIVGHDIIGYVLNEAMENWDVEILVKNYLKSSEKNILNCFISILQQLFQTNYSIQLKCFIAHLNGEHAGIDLWNLFTLSYCQYSFQEHKDGQIESIDELKENLNENYLSQFQLFQYALRFIECEQLETVVDLSMNELNNKHLEKQIRKFFYWHWFDNEKRIVSSINSSFNLLIAYLYSKEIDHSNEMTNDILTIFPSSYFTFNAGISKHSLFNNPLIINPHDNEWEDRINIFEIILRMCLFYLNIESVSISVKTEAIKTFNKFFPLIQKSENSVSFSVTAVQIMGQIHQLHQMETVDESILDYYDHLLKSIIQLIELEVSEKDRECTLNSSKYEWQVLERLNCSSINRFISSHIDNYCPLINSPIFLTFIYDRIVDICEMGDKKKEKSNLMISSFVNCFQSILNHLSTDFLSSLVKGTQKILINQKELFQHYRPILIIWNSIIEYNGDVGISCICEILDLLAKMSDQIDIILNKRQENKNEEKEGMEEGNNDLWRYMSTEELLREGISSILQHLYDYDITTFVLGVITTNNGKLLKCIEKKLSGADIILRGVFPLFYYCPEINVRESDISNFLYDFIDNQTHPSLLLPALIQLNSLIFTHHQTELNHSHNSSQQQQQQQLEQQSNKSSLTIYQFYTDIIVMLKKFRLVEQSNAVLEQKLFAFIDTSITRRTLTNKCIHRLYNILGDIVYTCREKMKSEQSINIPNLPNTIFQLTKCITNDMDTVTKSIPKLFTIFGGNDNHHEDQSNDDHQLSSIDDFLLYQIIIPIIYPILKKTNNDSITINNNSNNMTNDDRLGCLKMLHQFMDSNRSTYRKMIRKAKPIQRLFLNELFLNMEIQLMDWHYEEMYYYFKCLLSILTNHRSNLLQVNDANLINESMVQRITATLSTPTGNLFPSRLIIHQKTTSDIIQRLTILMLISPVNYFQVLHVELITRIQDVLIQLPSDRLTSSISMNIFNQLVSSDKNSTEIFDYLYDIFSISQSSSNNSSWCEAEPHVLHLHLSFALFARMAVLRLHGNQLMTCWQLILQLLQCAMHSFEIDLIDLLHQHDEEISYDYTTSLRLIIYLHYLKLLHFIQHSPINSSLHSSFIHNRWYYFINDWNEIKEKTIKLNDGHSCQILFQQFYSRTAFIPYIFRLSILIDLLIKKENRLSNETLRIIYNDRDMDEADTPNDYRSSLDVNENSEEMENILHRLKLLLYQMNMEKIYDASSYKRLHRLYQIDLLNSFGRPMTDQHQYS